jgi:drug/metabolite transporter (DMT)-like permease
MGARAQASLVAAIVAWAGAFAAIKVLVDAGFAGEDVAIARYAVAAPGFALLLVRAGGLPGLCLADAARIAAAGVLIVAGYHLSLNLGTEHTTAGTAALVVALAPALTVAAAAALGYEPLSSRRVAGLALAFAGVVIVIMLGSGASLSFADAKGPALVAGAPVAFALYNVLLNPLLGRYGVVALTAAASLAGTLALVPFVRPHTVGSLAGASVGELGLVLFLGLFSTLGAYLAWNAALDAVGPARVVVWANAVPPLAVVFAAITLGEPVSAWLAAGGALVVAGVLVAQRARAAAPAPRPRPAYAATGCSISGE